MPPSKAGYIKDAAKKRLARRMSERLMAITASQLVGSTPTPPPPIYADFFFWASILDLLGACGYLIADFGQGFIAPSPFWSVAIWIICGQIFLFESLCFCLSWRQADYAVGFWPHIFTEYVNVFSCSLYAITSVLYIYEPKGDDEALRAIYAVMFIECIAAISFSFDAWMYAYTWCVDNMYVLELYDENEARAAKREARARKLLRDSAAEAAEEVADRGHSAAASSGADKGSDGGSASSGYLPSTPVTPSAAAEAHTTLASAQQPPSPAWPARAPDAFPSSSAARSPAASKRSLRRLTGSGLAHAFVAAATAVHRWFARTSHWCYVYFIPRVVYGMPDFYAPTDPMAPMITPCSCQGKLCGKPMRQRCKYARLCFYQCYNIEMQEHVWNVIPSIIYIFWTTSVIWVQFNVYQQEVFLRAKIRGKATIEIASADCFPNVAYPADGFPPCNNPLCVLVWLQMTPPQNFPLARASITSSMRLSCSPLPRTPPPLTPHCLALKHRLFNASTTAAGNATCYAAEYYASPPCSNATWALGGFGPGPGWNASSPVPVGPNGSQIIASGVECFRLGTYALGDDCADERLWEPFHVNATNCTYHFSRQEQKLPAALKVPPCDDPLLWSGLRNGTADAIADTLDPQLAPLPLYKAQAVSWVARGFVYGDILFVFDAILVLYAWRDYFMQRERDYKAGRMTGLTHGDAHAHSSDDPEALPAAEAGAPAHSPPPPLAPPKDGWLEAAAAHGAVNPMQQAAAASAAAAAASATATTDARAGDHAWDAWETEEERGKRGNVPPPPPPPVAVSTSALTAQRLPTAASSAPPLGVAAAAIGAGGGTERAERVYRAGAGTPTPLLSSPSLATPTSVRVLNPLAAAAGISAGADGSGIEMGRLAAGFGGVPDATLGRRRTGIAGFLQRTMDAGASRVKLLRQATPR